jgi:disulfide bond formation protein DsbB
MRKVFNALFFVGAVLGFYFLIGNVLHWTGSYVAACSSVLCFSGGVFVRVLEI